MIYTIESVTSLLQIKNQWKSLWDKDPFSTPFQKFEYILNSINSLEQKDNLYIICIKNQKINEIVAVFPTSLSKGGSLKFINTAHSDFCGPLIHPEYNHYPLYKEFSDFIKSTKKIKRIEFFNVKDSYPILAAIRPFFPYTIVHDCNYYSSIHINCHKEDKNFISSFRFINSKRKNHLKNLLNKIPLNSQFKILENTSNAYPEDGIVNLVNYLIMKEGRDEKYFSPSMLNFWKSLYESGILKIAAIYNGKEMVACHFFFYDRKLNEYIMWILLYNDASFNTVIYVLLAKYIYENLGESKINFARGIYSYKIMHFHPDVYKLSCLKISKTGGGYLKDLFTSFIYYIKPLIKSILNRK